jgi:hypothetical protein
MSSAEQLANTVRERALENTLDQRVEVDMLFRTLKNAKVGTDEYKDAVSKLVAINPELSKQYVDQNGIIKDRIGYENALASSIMKRAEMEARAELIKEKFKAAQQARDTGETGSGFMNFVLGANELMGGSNAVLAADTRSKLAERNARNLEGEAGILSQQQADAQMLTKSETKTEKQKLEIDFKNMPAGVTTNLTGGSAINLPKTSSTR